MGDGEVEQFSTSSQLPFVSSPMSNIIGCCSRDISPSLCKDEMEIPFLRQLSIARIDPFYPVPCAFSDWFWHYGPCVEYTEDEYRDCIGAEVIKAQFLRGPFIPLSIGLLVQNIVFLFMEGYIISCIIGVLIRIHRRRTPI
jgi:hypothetical protein